MLAEEPAAPDNSKPFFEVTPLYNAGDAGYATYRIPAIAITRKGTILTACAGRLSGFGDWSDINTMFRRSTDGGKTWSEQEIITDDGKNTVDNATFIIDPESDNIYLMYQINYGRAYLKVSTDEGERWSAPREITDVFEVFRSRDGYPWTVLAMGPGHGITLKSGRLVVPVWLAASDDPHAHRPSISATIYSDDKGETWQAGDVFVKSTEQTPNPSENVLIELSDGRVMVNCRTESTKYRRLVSISPDGATGWSEPAFDDQLNEPICMASMIRYPSKLVDGKSAILFSNPNNADVEGGKKTKWGGLERKNVSVRASYDDGQTWPVVRSVEPGASGYSDMAVADDGTIYLLYEHGSVDEHGAFHTGTISIARFNLAWLTAESSGQ
ncbi:MAG: exo-alpha-sialidase [Phycisphaeraceae bacterium]|nr:exo-alpha-sialidase [Phycisphaeraceae bacterium]